MPGIIVTKSENGGYTIKAPEHVNIQFPPPPKELAELSAQDLREHIFALAHDLRLLSEKFRAEVEMDWNSPDNIQNVVIKYAQTYEQKFSQRALFAASAALNRIGKIESTEISREASLGSSVVYHKKFVGADPAKQAALFLEVLANKLRN
jgi:hypothetical protein